MALPAVFGRTRRYDGASPRARSGTRLASIRTISTVFVLITLVDWISLCSQATEGRTYIRREMSQGSLRDKVCFDPDNIYGIYVVTPLVGYISLYIPAAYRRKCVRGGVLLDKQFYACGPPPDYNKTMVPPPPPPSPNVTSLLVYRMPQVLRWSVTLSRLAVCAEHTRRVPHSLVANVVLCCSYGGHLLLRLLSPLQTQCRESPEIGRAHV